jgi:hypothetical protein
MAQAFSRRSLPSEAWVRSRVGLCGICCGQSGTGTCFCPSSLTFSCQFAGLISKTGYKLHSHKDFGETFCFHLQGFNLEDGKQHVTSKLCHTTIRLHGSTSQKILVWYLVFILCPFCKALYRLLFYIICVTFTKEENYCKWYSQKCWWRVLMIFLTFVRHSSNIIIIIITIWLYSPIRALASPYRVS